MVLGFGFKAFVESFGFRFRVLLRVLCIGFRVLGFGFQFLVSGFGFGAWGLGLWV